MPLIDLSAFSKYITICVFPAVGISDLCVHSDFAEASEQHSKRIRTSHEIIENVCECLFCNYSNLVPPTRPGSQMKGAATEKHKELKCCKSLCSWHKFYLWFLLQLCVYNPVARCSPFLHSMMPKVIIISKNLQKTKERKCHLYEHEKYPLLYRAFMCKHAGNANSSAGHAIFQHSDQMEFLNGFFISGCISNNRNSRNLCSAFCKSRKGLQSLILVVLNACYKSRDTRNQIWTYSMRSMTHIHRRLTQTRPENKSAYEPHLPSLYVSIVPAPSSTEAKVSPHIALVKLSFQTFCQ